MKRFRREPSKRCLRASGILLLGLGAVVTRSTPATATIAPAPGSGAQVPSDLVVRSEHGGWTNKVKRARAARLQSGAVSESFVSGTVQVPVIPVVFQGQAPPAGDLDTTLFGAN